MKKNSALDNKLLSSKNIQKQINIWRQKNEKIVFTNGCFDILHKGHLDLLCLAANHGSKLIVAVNSDKSIKRLKGEERPIINEATRARILAYFNFIDAVIIFSQETPYQLIKEIKPDILVKGGDYKKEDIVGYDIVKENNGEVIIFPFINGYSSTNIIEKIKNL